MRSKMSMCLLLLVFCSATAFPMPLYSLKVGEFMQQEKALDYQKQLSETMTPVFVESISEGVSWKIMVGHFESKAEAWVYQQKMGTQFSSCAIENWKWDGRALQFEATLPVKMPFNESLMEGLPRSADCLLDYESRGDAPQQAKAALSAQSLEVLDGDSLYQRGDWAKTNVEGIAALELLIQKYPEHALVNTAKLRLVKRYLGSRNLEGAEQLLDEVEKKGTWEEKSRVPLLRAYCVLYSPDYSKEETYQAFCKVASDSQVLANDRVDAMLRAAAKAHQMRNYPDAWLAFSQLERAVDNPKIVAYARMQKAGLAFELVGRDVGDWEDVRSLCAKVLDMDDAPKQVKATAALMAMETFYQQRDYQLALTEAERLVEDYSDCKREWALGRVWTGVIQEMLGQKTDALKTFEAIYQEVDFEYPKYSFKGNNIRTLAAYRAALLCESEPTRRNKWINELQSNYPDSDETRSIKQHYQLKGGK